MNYLVGGKIDEQLDQQKKSSVNEYAFVSRAEMSDITWVILVKNLPH